MTRIGVEISFSEEAHKIIDQIKKNERRGLLSQICNEAILRWKKQNFSINEIKNRILENKQLINKSSSDNKFLNKELEKKEKLESEKQQDQKQQQQQQDQKQQQQQQQQQQAVLNSCIKQALKIFKISDKQAKTTSKEFLKTPIKKRNGFVSFIISKGFKRK